MSLKRVFRHLVATGFGARRTFDQAALAAIEGAIAESERTHGGEICVAFETSLSAYELLRGVTPRARALQVFASLGVWDTEANNGVLIYVLWADHDVEIVADRGYNGRVSQQEWEAVCRKMEKLFAEGRAVDAVLAGIEGVGALSAKHYPASDRDELPNRPVFV
ncbi:MAG: TPM domain-containing protein [Gammaproteobacteria bacterium]|nr:hypothetical protein [Gammaproteobacteria bacterium]